MKNNNLKSGVSMVALIVIVILLVVIAGSIVLSSVDGGFGLVKNANETVLKNDIKVMIESYNAVYDDLEYEYSGDVSLIKDSDFQNKNIIPKKYTGKFTVTKDGIKYIGTDANEKQIAKNMGAITT